MWEVLEAANDASTGPQLSPTAGRDMVALRGGAYAARIRAPGDSPRADAVEGVTSRAAAVASSREERWPVQGARSTVAGSH